MKRLVMGTLTVVLVAGGIPAGDANGINTAYATETAPTAASDPGDPSGQEPVITQEPEPAQPDITDPPVTDTPAPTDPTATVTPAPADPGATVTPTPADPDATVTPTPADPDATVTPTPADPDATVTPTPADPAATVTPTPAPEKFSVKILANPTDALVVVLDHEGNILTPDGVGTYQLQEKQEYEIYVRKDGYQEIHQKITADPSVTEYEFRLLSQDATLSELYVSSSDKYGKGILKLTPDFSLDQDHYQATYEGERQSLNVWPEVKDPNASVKVYAINGIKASTIEKDETIKGTTDKKKHPYWKIVFADQAKEAGIRIQITAEDKTQKDIYVTLRLTDVTAPILKRVSASRISTENASVVYKTSERGTCYYQVIEENEKIPVLDTSGAGTAVLSGTNTISLSGLTPGEKKIVLAVKDDAGNVSSSLVIDIPDIKNSSQSNLVHGSDHGGNKSQAVIPGNGGEGSLSNLKQVTGTKGKSGALLDTIKNTENTSDELKVTKERPSWTIKKHLIPVKTLSFGSLVNGKKIITEKEENPKEERQKSLESQESQKSLVSSETKQTKDQLVKNQITETTETTETTGKTSVLWNKPRLLTKVLLVFAGMGILFLMFFAGAKRRFRKLRLQLK